MKGQRAEWIRGTFSPLLTEMEGGAIAQVCLRNGVRFVSVKSVSDHLFSDSQAEEYFDFGQALEALGRAVLPLAKALQKAGRENGAPGGDDPRRALVSVSYVPLGRPALR